MRLPVYRTVFDTVLTRTDAEDAHHRAFGAWRRLAAVPRLTDLVQATLTRPDPEASRTCRDTVVRLCLEHGFRYAGRLHLDLFGGRRGA